MQRSFFKYRLGPVQSISFGLTVISVFNNIVFEVLLKLGTFSKVRMGRSIVLHNVAVMLKGISFWNIVTFWPARSRVSG